MGWLWRVASDYSERGVTPGEYRTGALVLYFFFLVAAGMSLVAAVVVLMWLKERLEDGWNWVGGLFQRGYGGGEGGGGSRSQNPS